MNLGSFRSQVNKFFSYEVYGKTGKARGKGIHAYGI